MTHWMDSRPNDRYFSRVNAPILTTEELIAAPGGRIFAKCWTPGEAPLRKPPVVLLHDSLGCVEMWRDFPRRLSERLNRKVIAYDRLGFGRSSPRNGLPSARFVSEEAEIYLPVILSALEVERFAAFGHSVGGAMAVVSAGTLCERCEAVITESAQAFVEDRTWQAIDQAKADFQNPAVFTRLERYHGDKARWVLSAWTDVWLSAPFADWSLARDLPKMRCPALAIHGDRDEYGSHRFPEMICQLAGGPARKEIIADCGHVPHREKEELVLGLAAEFLAAPTSLTGG